MTRTEFYRLGLLCVAAVLVSSPSPVSLAGAAKCPLSGQPVDPEQWIFSEGKRVAFCCPKCKSKFTTLKENRLSASEEKDGWKLLFNGRDLDGFGAPTREGKWRVDGGVLVGSGGPGVLGTMSEYENFTLQLDARVSDTGERRGNSGVFIRSKGLTALRGRWPDGPEIQIDHGDENYWTGAVWKKARAKKVTTRDGEWLQLRIEAVGKVIRIWVNGELVTRYTQAESSRAGPIAFQVHHLTDVVEFKNVKIRPLINAPEAKAG